MRAVMQTTGNETLNPEALLHKSDVQEHPRRPSFSSHVSPKLSDEQTLATTVNDNKSFKKDYAYKFKSLMYILL
jgi:hypothetical protein